MSYGANSELPSSVKNQLDEAQQTLYRKAYNQALGSFSSDPKKADGVAWTAVKNKYRKVGSKWMKKAKLSVGSKVTWGSSGGKSEGRIKSVKTSGKVTEGTGSAALDASTDDPVYVIEVMRNGEATGDVVRHHGKALMAKASSLEKNVSIDIPITKTNDEKQQVFGWAYVTETGDGLTLDHSGERISIDELEDAAYRYNQLEKRQGGEMHVSKDAGELIESIVFTKDKYDALGVPEENRTYGWWVGYQINDSSAWGRVKDGTYKMLSVGGSATRKEV